MKKIILFFVAFAVQLNYAQNIFPSDGNVGIGTSSPNTKLSVLGNISKLTLSGIDGIYDNLIKYGHKADLESASSFVNRWHGIDATITAGNSEDNKLKFRLYSGSTANLEPIDVMTLLGNGKVGIGTTSPSSKLDVAGEVRSYGVGFGQIDAVTSAKNYANFSSNNHGSVLLSSNLYFSTNDVLKIANTHGTMAGGAILLPGNSQPNQGKIQFLTTTPTSVTQDQLFAGTISMEITGNGNVGIGIINPSNKLDVNGTIHSKEVKIDMTGWSDFVFKKEYNLPTLEEVEKHIVEKGHLENIPSEKEVLKDGISLGEMNAKLLQKIEELTLYMIEMKKDNERIKLENDLIKKNQIELEKQIRNK